MPPAALGGQLKHHCRSGRGSTTAHGTHGHVNTIQMRPKADKRAYRRQRVATAEDHVLAQILHNTGFPTSGSGGVQAKKVRTGPASARSRTRELNSPRGRSGDPVELDDVVGAPATSRCHAGAREHGSRRCVQSGVRAGPLRGYAPGARVGGGAFPRFACSHRVAAAAAASAAAAVSAAAAAVAAAAVSLLT